MLITDKILYIELHKTGCTYTRQILADMFTDTATITGKHNTTNRIPNSILGNFEEKYKIGNIRNPWDWYVSLWAYGCMKKGAVYHQLTSGTSILHIVGIKSLAKRILKIECSRLKANIGKQLYSDSNNYENFNKWLRIILSYKNYEIGAGYKTSKLSKIAGLLTYRYLKLYTYKKQFRNIDTPKKIKQYDVENNFIDYIIKTEEINTSLHVLTNIINYDKEKFNNILSKHKNRVNSSNREKDYRKYYDANSISLVEKFERFIIDKYNYRFE